MLEFAEKAIEMGRQIGQADILATGFRLMADAFYLMENCQRKLFQSALQSFTKKTQQLLA